MALQETISALQVNCRDRRGLLSDVITALKSFPLEITTAAVTTTADGYVYDVFQVLHLPVLRLSLPLMPSDGLGFW